MKNITFHDSFTPTGAAYSVKYDNGPSLIFWVENPIFALTRNPCDVSAHRVNIRAGQAPP